MEKPKLGPWDTIKQGLDKYDEEMCDAWNDELNTILTFVRELRHSIVSDIEGCERPVYSLQQ